MEHQSAAKKGKTLIFSFFKKRDRQTSEDTSIPTVLTMQHQSSESLLFPNIQIPSCSSPRDDHQSSSTFIERDPGKRKQICEYHVNVRDEIRRSYLNMGPYQPDMLEYPASSPHTMCERRAENLMRPSQHIDKVMHAQSKEEKEKNRLRLSTSIVAVRWLALQGCAFRGNDESLSSSNRGNFLELVKAFAKMNIEIDEVVLENAPKNAQYIAPEIQKEILHIMANRVRKMVREEVGDKYFCILVDEARDISKREQMAIILRFVNNHGILTERFFVIKSVSDTTSMNLKNEISNVLVHHDLHVKKIRGQ
ncbi:uncharacterized protein [Primulina eburnea]|uniref:uncharacterized protein n=1 Tax=Primulina eburnea TaxID=1245227 RepID=UPI003C6BE711